MPLGSPPAWPGRPRARRSGARSGVTFIVGQNGSGKSTLVEGIAVAAGARGRPLAALVPLPRMTSAGVVSPCDTTRSGRRSLPPDTCYDSRRARTAARHRRAVAPVPRVLRAPGLDQGRRGPPGQRPPRHGEPRPLGRRAPRAACGRPLLRRGGRALPHRPVPELPRGPPPDARGAREPVGRRADALRGLRMDRPRASDARGRRPPRRLRAAGERGRRRHAPLHRRPRHVPVRERQGDRPLPAAAPRRTGPRRSAPRRSAGATASIRSRSPTSSRCGATRPTASPAPRASARRPPATSWSPTGRWRACSRPPPSRAP